MPPPGRRCRSPPVTPGQKGVLRKVHPWEMRAEDPGRQIERARAAAARLIGADARDVAVISSVSYGVATAGKILPLPRGSRVLVLQDDHSSPVLEWMKRCKDAGATLQVIARPEDGDWTEAVPSGDQPSRGSATGRGVDFERALV